LREKNEKELNTFDLIEKKLKPALKKIKKARYYKRFTFISVI